MNRFNNLLIILLLEGFITISVEILTIRQLLPFYGGSVVITSIIIGVFLLFLAIGYWRGGVHQQDYFRQLSRNFSLSLVWIGIGLSYTLISLFYYLSVPSMHFSFLFSLSLYLLFILAPVVYWLGQTVPLTTNLFNQQQRVSRISAHALFLSTIGSFLGAILTSLLLFQFLGVAWAVVINCGLLFCLVIMIRKYSEVSVLEIAILFIALIFITFLNLLMENGQFIKTNNYANYQIIETAEFNKILSINQSASSQLTYDKKAFPYIEFIRNLLFTELNLRHKKILVIGAGGFSLTAAGTNDNEVVYVDIDGELKHIAETAFLNGPIQGRFIGEDARRYLKEATDQYDVIISDVYSNQATIPPSLLSVEYFQSIANHLHPRGLFIANIIANPFFQDDYSRIVFNTIHSVFPFCSTTPLTWRNVSNVMYICTHVESKNAIYSDDLNTSTLDSFKAKQSK